MSVEAKHAADKPAHPAAPLIEVRYQDVTYHVQVPKQAVKDELPSVARTVRNTLLGPFNAAFTLASKGSLSAPKRSIEVLQGVTGVLKPGTLTLVLSPPGHGKSAYLKAVSKQLPHRGLSGSVSYSGSADGKDAGAHLGQLVQYVSQTDEHLPHLTVRETLAFVHANATVDPALHGYPHLAGQHAQQLEDVMGLLHLYGCANTIIGNDLLRGVSGGEKKRVTVGEGLLTHAQVLCLDEPSTGLDSSVTCECAARGACMCCVGGFQRGS
jgi:ABC-type multidrug transport system ATPase subunit